MTVRIGWDEYEVALLIDACNRIRDNKIDKAECVHKLSNLLRQRAKAKGINIDEVFRNENGIALQMTKMEYLLTDGKKGLPGASKLYIEMAKMSKLNSDEFEKILILAKEQIGYKEAMNNMNTREKFIQWLSSNPISKYSSNTIVNALDEGSEYCCSRSLSKVSFWDMNNKNEFITVASKLLGMKIYRLMHKKTAIVLDKAVPLYKKFLQQSEKRSGIKIPDVEISTEGSGDNVEAKDNQSSDSKYSQIYQKLYYISKVYDDPNGMTLEKIMSMLGNGTDEELVISILNDVSWATKLADDIYSFGKNANSVLREQVQPYKIEEKDIVTDGQFFDFLYNYEKMAEASCRSYVSAIRTAEEYAKNHNYASHMIYDCGFEDASTLIRELMGDNEFLEFNAKQHNRFRAAFKKYLKMGGQLPAKERKSLSVKKTSLPVANEIEKVQPKDFDKSKFEITLLRRYRNGMQFDSIDFENFREMYDALFDETLTFDDEALEERLRYCGVLYKDRLFPAEGIIDNNTKETLFAYIDNCFSTGKSVLYYKAIYQDLSDAFASCFTLADEKMLKAYIEYSAEKDKYYYFSDYMSVDRNVKIDHTEEIEEYFLSAGKPMRLDDVFSTLSHIPQERVDRIIKTDSRFLRNSKGEYFHTDIFEITDDELENIAEIIEGFISEDEYAIWTNVWNMIQDKFPLFVENNLYLSGLGIRNAIEQRFSGRFRFEGAVISLPKDSFSRLLPFVEKRINLIELAPKGTGKSYVFGHISKNGLLTDGGKVTRSKMFYDANRRKPGYICGPDYVAIDEVKLVNFGDENEMRSILQGYLEYGTFNSNGYNGESDAGVVFLGNIKEENMDEYGYMLGELPTLFQETALLDRIHGFVKGWDIPRMNDGLKLTGWALNSEYFCSILHELRNDMSYRAIVEKIVEVPEHADTRDTEAIKRLATAYLKLLFPKALVKVIKG